MSETQTDQSATQQIIAQAPGADVALIKRSIQMRQFKTRENVRHCVAHQVLVPLGQIVGEVLRVDVKEGTLPNGEAKRSLFAVGRFEASVYETGEILNAHGAFLPGYYMEHIQAQQESNGGRPIRLAIEILAEPTGTDEKTGLPKSIPFAYGIKNLIANLADDPIEVMKRQLQKSNRLRLPPPVALPRASARLALPSSASSAAEYVDDGADDNEDTPANPVVSANPAAPVNPDVSASDAASQPKRAKK